MSTTLLLVQALNGLQLGILLFLLAAGLTLVFGIMNFINLAHGSLYMMGAFIAATVFRHTGSFLLAAAAVIAGMAALGLLLDRIALARLYPREHLDQVLATFGFILFFNELTRIIWGPAPISMGLPSWLSGTIDILGVTYPLYRFLIIVVGLLVAAGCYVLIHRTRLGMLIRAGSTDRMMVGALGVNIARLNTLLFVLGAVLAGLAGLMAGPILSAQTGMGEPILILTLVVIVIGGIGSVRGAFLAALMVGLIDTLGRALLPTLLRAALPPAAANAAGPAIASMLIYVVMALAFSSNPGGRHIAAVAGAGSRLRAMARRTFPAGAVRPRAGLRRGRAGAEPAAGIWRHGQLRPRHVLRVGRLRGGHHRLPYRRSGADLRLGGQQRGAGGVADRAGGLRAGRLDLRLPGAAHARCAVHHDHAGVRADVLFPGAPSACSTWAAASRSIGRHGGCCWRRAWACCGCGVRPSA
ncbi:hypothetical protein G6F57_013635 [Rhizopus arrhizus]|nr:hypothetical protein G6F57_013635 [Rhizopus arrhizus]